MKLPQSLYNSVKSHMAHHVDWHNARLHRNWIPVQEREQWDKVRGRCCEVIPITQVGSGRQFLEFHRLMMRHFRWLVENTSGHSFVLQPWTGVPDWLKATSRNPGGFTAEYLRAQELRTRYLIYNGTADELGNFLESTHLDNTFGSNLHNLCHGAIASFEASRGFGYEGAEMDDFSKAHFNEHFWNFHAWLDNIYAEWQLCRGEHVDQTPRDPRLDHGGTSHHSSSHGHDHDHEEGDRGSRSHDLHALRARTVAK